MQSGEEADGYIDIRRDRRVCRVVGVGVAGTDTVTDQRAFGGGGLCGHGGRGRERE